MPCAAMENDEMKNGKAENKGGRGAAKCPRPVWVDDRDAAELPNFEPSPALYNCACAFLWDEAQRAFADGDNTLLSRAGVADAIEFITNPCNAGTGAAAYAEMLEDWRRAMKAEAAQAEARKTAKMINADLPRIDFWRKFEPDADRDADAMVFRRVFLIRRRGGLLRLMQKMKEQGDVATCDAMTDAFIFPAIDTANPEPEHVRAYWLNSCFSMAGEELARWLSVAALPNYEKQLAELRGRIADNFGVFPAPFECVEDDSGDLCAPRNVIRLCAKIHEQTGNAKKAKEAREALKKIPVRRYVRLDGDELQTLLYIARAQARQTANGGGRSKQGAANPSGNAGADVCAAHDELLSAYARRIISNYRAGISFDFLTDTGRVHIADLTQKQWEAARQLLETPPDDENAGWVKMPDGWKIPQRCKGGQATFFDRVHSKAQESANGKGAGYYRIARDIAKRGRGGKRAGSGRPRKK